MYDDNYYNHSFEPAAKLDSLSFGNRCDWYIDANVEACEEEVAWQQVGSRLWPRGWFAIVRYWNHDDMRDSRVNEQAEYVVSGPYPFESEALEAAEDALDDVIAELTS